MHCGKTNIKKLEKLNERALRFVNNDMYSNYETQLEKSRKNSLLKTRLKFLAVEMYKVKNNLTPNYIFELFTPEILPYNLRYTEKFILPAYRTKTYGYRSFNYMGAKLWNNLDNNCRNSSSLFQFVSYWSVVKGSH